MRVDINGNVGIGTTSPSQKLEVNGFIKAQGIVFPTGTQTVPFNICSFGMRPAPMSPASLGAQAPADSCEGGDVAGRLFDAIERQQTQIRELQSEVAALKAKLKDR